MSLKLHNTLSKKTELFTPLNASQSTIYTCGPTVYDHAHIGNLSSFIFADILRRTISANGLNVKHVMNLTDVDDKTIRRSQELYPELDSKEALAKLTQKFGQLFIEDMQAIGNDTASLTILRATDPKTIEGIKQLINELYDNGFAYIAADGVYFSIDAYRKSGKKYGQLVEVSEESTTNERIQNDEYDKDSPHDFALWKRQKGNEPAWDFVLDGNDMTGRPGWHIECSAMSRQGLGQPFDIHTGGIDLMFPHHENEIAQSTAGRGNPTYAQVFVHSEHMLVDGKKMAKSSQNFYTLQDLQAQQVDPLAFRLLVLQSHYRKATNFNLDNAAAAHNRLQNWKNIAALRHQIHDTIESEGGHTTYLNAASRAIIEALSDDLDTPAALAIIDQAFSQISNHTTVHRQGLVQLLETIDETLGLQLIASTPDISDDAKQLILQRERAREDKDWARSDEIRNQLAAQNITLRDTAHGTVWEYEK